MKEDVGSLTRMEAEGRVGRVSRAKATGKPLPPLFALSVLRATPLFSLHFHQRLQLKSYELLEALFPLEVSPIPFRCPWVWAAMVGKWESMEERWELWLGDGRRRWVGGEELLGLGASVYEEEGECEGDAEEEARHCHTRHHRYREVARWRTRPGGRQGRLLAWTTSRSQVWKNLVVPREDRARWGIGTGYSGGNDGSDRTRAGNGESRIGAKDDGMLATVACRRALKERQIGAIRTLGVAKQSSPEEPCRRRHGVAQSTD